MNVNPGNGREGLPIDWVKRQFEAISMIDPAPSLRDKLEAGIPGAAANLPRTQGLRAWLRGARWAGVAAAVLIVVSVVAWLRMPLGRHRCSGIDGNTNSGRAYAADYNSLRPPDTNLCDINSLR